MSHRIAIPPDSPLKQRQKAGGLNAVLAVSLALIAGLLLWAATAPEQLGAVMSSSLDTVSASFGWAYLVVTLFCIVLLLFFSLSRYGSARLGQPGDRPEFSTWTWLAMIVTAVMGIGMISYGVAEPMFHYMEPPHAEADPETHAAAVSALQYSFFHWGPHAWAVFGVFGLAIAYSTHRKNRPGLVSPMLRPVLGKLVDGWVGKIIDIFTIVATLFGTTTSLGLGAAQIEEGLGQVFGIPAGMTTQVVIILSITLIFTLSALSGVHRGIKYISQITMIVGPALAVYVLLFGPTNFVSNVFFSAVGQYGSEFLGMSLATPGSADDLAWMQGWTYFMMAWWLSWGAFVGVFIARVSRGRTVREFALCVLGVPSLVFFAWFTVFGGSAIALDREHGTDIGEQTVENINSAFFALLDNLPLTTLTSVVAIVLVVLFFVSGADANTYVLSMLSSRGSMIPPVWLLALWGALTGVCAVALLYVGGLQALQHAALLSAFPFTIIVGLLGLSVLRELHNDPQLWDWSQAPETAEESSATSG